MVQVEMAERVIDPAEVIAPGQQGVEQRIDIQAGLTRVAVAPGAIADEIEAQAA